MAANQELRDRAIRHAIYLQRFGGAVVNRVIALLNRSDADLVEQIQQRLARIAERGYDTGPATTKRLQQVLGELRALNRQAYTAAGRELTEQLRGLAAYEVEWQASAIESLLPARVNVNMPAPRMVTAAALARPFQGRHLKEWLDGLEAAKATRVRDAIRLGLVEGETIDQMVRRIRGTRALGYADGLMEIDRRGAQAMVRTAVTHVAGVAREAVFTDNADILAGVRWVATLDARTTPVCQARDGKVFPLESGPRPPAHIGCRSATAPVLNDKFAFLSEGATRAAKGGQVDQNETYQSWLKRQSAAFQDEVLGPTRAELFRRGGLTLDRFVNRAGDELTLDELRKREPAAFSKVERGAGLPKLGSAKAADRWAVDYVRSNGVAGGVEYAAAYRQDGSVALTKRGRSSSVAFSPDERRSLKGLTLVHNHPRGTSLSGPDLEFAAANGLRRIVAVPSHVDGYFEARPLKGQAETRRAHASAYRHAYDVLSAATIRGRITAAQADQLHAHMANLALHNHGVVAYSAKVVPQPLRDALSAFGEHAFNAAVAQWTP